MPTGPGAGFVRFMNEIGFSAGKIGSGGTASGKLGTDFTCALSTNDYQLTFNGWRNTIPTILVTSLENSSMIQVASKSTTTCTLTPRRIALTGGTGTVAAFNVMILGRASM